MISFRCHNCGNAYEAESQHGGKTTRCPGCNLPIVLPSGRAIITLPQAPAPLRKPELVKQGPDTALILTAVLFGLPLLLFIGWLSFALVLAPSKEARERMEAGADNRREWVSLTYGTIIAYKNESRWTDTITATGKTVSEHEFRGKTDDYVELFNLNPDARDLLRLYKDRMECKHATGWVVIGSGHWKDDRERLGGEQVAKNAEKAKATGAAQTARNAEQEKQRLASEKAKKGLGVTLKAYYQIKMGMTYEEVYGIIGQHGVELSSISLEEIDLHMLQWSGDGLLGGSMMLQFDNGKVSSRSHFGLR